MPPVVIAIVLVIIGVITAPYLSGPLGLLEKGAKGATKFLMKIGLLVGRTIQQFVLGSQEELSDIAAEASATLDEREEEAQQNRPAEAEKPPRSENAPGRQAARAVVKGGLLLGRFAKNVTSSATKGLSSIADEARRELDTADGSAPTRDNPEA